MSMSILFAFVCKLICEVREIAVFFTHKSGTSIYFSQMKVNESQVIYSPKDALNPE